MNEITEATLTIWPRPARAIIGAKVRQPLTTPSKFTASCLSQASFGWSRNPPTTAMPALLTRTSGTPCANWIVSATAAQLSLSVTSSW